MCLIPALARPGHPKLGSNDLDPHHWVFTVDDPADEETNVGPDAREDAVQAHWPAERTVHFSGPGFLDLAMGRHACELQTPWRWSTLIDDPVYAAIQAVVRELARLLESPSAFYIPDSAFAPAGVSDLVYEGATLAEIEAWLDERCGSPASDPASIIRPAHNKPYRFDIAENGYLKAGFSSPQPYK